jgi:hypothetical protein
LAPLRPPEAELLLAGTAVVDAPATAARRASDNAFVSTPSLMDVEENAEEECPLAPAPPERKEDKSSSLVPLADDEDARPGPPVPLSFRPLRAEEGV